jgi:hypothetical protein
LCFPIATWEETGAEVEAEVEEAPAGAEAEVSSWIGQLTSGSKRGSEKLVELWFQKLTES